MRKSVLKRTSAQKYLSFIEDIEADVRSAQIEIHRDNIVLREWSHGRASLVCQRKINHPFLRDYVEALTIHCSELKRNADAHRTYLPLVKAGLMSVSECVREVSMGHVARPVNLPSFDFK
jgi:hypothetical protein